MSSEPTGDTQRPAVSADQADGHEAPQPDSEPAVAEAAAAPAAPPGGCADAVETADPAADAAAAETSATTMVLDPEPDPGAEEYGEPGRAPVSKLAIVAMITGILALVPISVACAVGSLIGISRTGRRGHGMAMAGLFASAAWVIAAVAVGTVGVLTHGFKKPVTVKYRESAVFKLQEGDCVNMPNGQVVTILPCATPHEAEVFATFALPGTAWPGTTAVRQQASSGCESRLTGYINPQLAISLAQSYVFPDKVAWTAGTRTVICEVRASSGQLTGSVRGAGS
jgi:hypothetical protein